MADEDKREPLLQRPEQADIHKGDHPRCADLGFVIDSAPVSAPAFVSSMSASSTLQHADTHDVVKPQRALPLSRAALLRDSPPPQALEVFLQSMLYGRAQLGRGALIFASTARLCAAPTVSITPKPICGICLLLESFSTD